MPNPQTSGPGYLCSSGTLLRVSMGGPTSSQAAVSTAFKSLMHASSHTQPNLPSTRWRYQQVNLLQDGIPFYPIVRMTVSVYQFHFFTFLQSVSQSHIFFLAYMVLPTILSKFTTQKQNILGAIAGTTSPMLKIRFLPTFCAQITSIKNNIWPIL